MRRLEHLGPALVTLAAAGALLLVAPAAVRQLSRESAAVQMAAADARLAQGSVLEAMSQSMRDIATLVEPSVVHVSMVGGMGGRNGGRTYQNSGSGWVYDTLGHIVTNAHVVDGAQRLEVQFRDGERIDARLMGLDLRTDIAVLQVDPAGLVPARRARQDPQQGDMVFAFGSPFDFRFSMSSGIVSGLARSAGLQEIDYENFIQTDAAINPGNSGGPLTDTRGNVVGMTTAIATGRGNALGQGQFAGIGLAIPISMIENVVDQLITRGEVEKGFLGVSSVDVEDVRTGRSRAGPMREATARFQGDGAAVEMVTPGSPAEQAGLRAGDVITGIGGQRVASSSQLRTLTAGCRPGETVKVDLWRPNREGDEPGENLSLQVTMGRLSPETNMEPLVQTMRNLGLLRLITCTETDAERRHVTFRRGVLVEQVAADSPAAAELPEGSIIFEAAGGPVNNLDDLYLRIMRGVTQGRRGLNVPVAVQRPDGSTVRLVLPLSARQ
jgi:serine protease Do